MFIKSIAIAATLMMIPVAAQANPSQPIQSQSNRAQTVGWNFIPSACPDLVEDRRDARVTYSRRDAREDIRDARTVTCPASAWSYTPTAGDRRQSSHVVYSGSRVVYANRQGQYYMPRAVQLPLQYQVQPVRRAQPTEINIIIR